MPAENDGLTRCPKPMAAPRLFDQPLARVCLAGLLSWLLPGAAQEIKTLIQASVERVQAGSELAHNAGGTMAEVVSSIRSVSELMHT